MIHNSTIIQAADKATGIASGTQGIEAGQGGELGHVFRIQIGQLLGISSLVIIGGFKDIHKLGHTGADNHAVFTCTQIQG